MLETIVTAMLRNLYYWAMPLGIVVMGFVIVKTYYCPRSAGEWRKMFFDSGGRQRLRQRKKRLDAIRNRRPGSILPGIPTSQRDFALEPLIRNRKFKEAKAYIMEQIRRIREAPGASGKVRVYIQYLELIEGTV
jgi:hypothetical protein